LFFKAQRQTETKAPATPAMELLHDLEMVVAIVNRAQRRLAGSIVGRAGAGRLPPSA
jgi:hypothetical protein